MIIARNCISLGNALIHDFPSLSAIITPDINGVAYLFGIEASAALGLANQAMYIARLKVNEHRRALLAKPWCTLEAEFIAKKSIYKLHV